MKYVVEVEHPKGKWFRSASRERKTEALELKAKLKAQGFNVRIRTK